MTTTKAKKKSVFYYIRQRLSGGTNSRDSLSVRLYVKGLLDTKDYGLHFIKVGDNFSVTNQDERTPYLTLTLESSNRVTLTIRSTDLVKETDRKLSEAAHGKN